MWDGDAEVVTRLTQLRNIDDLDRLRLRREAARYCNS